jgi:hypothetical protein
MLLAGEEALERVSTRIEDGDRFVARSQLLQSAKAFDGMLTDHWPPAVWREGQLARHCSGPTAWLLA